MRWFWVFLLSLVVAGGCAEKPVVEKAPIACSTSYIEAIVYDLLGVETKVLRLAGPSMCPGHFDIRPSQVRLLANCRLLLRFDFQRALEKKLAGLNRDKLEVAEIRPESGLCVPQTYISGCRQCAKILTQAGLADADAMKRRLKVIERRISELSKRVRSRIRQSGLQGLAVLASVHQKEFCKWLGLKVVAELPAADKSDFRAINVAINAALDTNVKFVIANLQEGRQLADAIADRLNAKVVVFSNFPRIGKPNRRAFDRLITENVDNLIKCYANNRD